MKIDWPRFILTIVITMVLVVALMLLAGCNTQAEQSSDDDTKQIHWCVGACMFGRHATRNEETQAEIKVEKTEKENE